MFNWNFQKAAMYLIDNSEQVQEDILIAENKKILLSFELEGLKIQNGIVEFKFKNEEESKNKFDINQIASLKWVNTGNYIIAYRYLEGECYVFAEDKFVGKFSALQMNKVDYLMTYDCVNKKYYIVSNYSFIAQSIIVGDCQIDAVNSIEKKMKNDIDLQLKLSDKTETMTLREFSDEVDKVMMLFSIRKNLTFWKYKNWNYYYATLYNNLVYNKRDTGQKGTKKFASMLKSIIHKLDKFRIKNENELISQLKKLYNDADEFDLDLTGKYYKSQPYDKMPTPEIVNWCSWNYNKSFLFEKKTEDDKKESTVEVVTSNENKDEEKGSKNPTSPIRLLYLDNKIETFFG